MRILFGTTAALALCFVLAGCGTKDDTLTAEAPPAPRVDQEDDELAPSTDEAGNAEAANSPAPGAGNSAVDPDEPPAVEEEPVATGPRPSLWIEMITAPLGELMTNTAASLQQGIGQSSPGRDQRNSQDEPAAETEPLQEDSAPEDDADLQ